MTETKTQKPRTRQHEHVLEIASSPEEVWKAITEASELVNWFPLEAEVEPGEGGSITLGWGEALRGTCTVEAWEPQRRLKTNWVTAVPVEGDSGAALAVDWFLEATKRGTRLRLVHSGFGFGEEWDKEYDGTRRGWSYELRSLKHYLETHPGEKRTCFWLRRPFAAGASEAWRRLIHPEGLIQSGRPAEAKAGDSVRLHLSSGDTVQGRVLLSIPPTDIALVVDNWNRGLFRVAHEDFGQGPELCVMASLWGYPQAKAERLKERLDRALDRAASR